MKATFSVSKEQAELIEKLLHNLRGVSTAEMLGLPFADSELEIYEEDAKVFIKTSNNKISYFYTENNFISHLELLRRIMYNKNVKILGSELEDLLELETQAMVLLKRRKN